MKLARAVPSVLVGAGGVVVIAACGDVYADPDGSEQTASRPRIEVDGSAVFPADTPPRCPLNRPRENSSCAASGSTCEYGKSADRECNAMLACLGAQPSGYWEARASDPCFSSVCPARADVASLDGKPCSLGEGDVRDGDLRDGGVTDADEAVCNMTDGICACTTGRDGTTAHARRWICVRPISVCPPNRPLAGQPCIGGLWCDYGSCAFKRGLLMECKDGMWMTGGAPCQ